MIAKCIVFREVAPTEDSVIVYQRRLRSGKKPAVAPDIQKDQARKQSVVTINQVTRVSQVPEFQPKMTGEEDAIARR